MSRRNLGTRLRILRSQPTPSAAERASAGESGAAGAANANGSRPQASAAPELVQRRDQLAKEFTELQWDLGGLAYEMASRDHFRLDVLVRQAARLQQVDAELAEAERILRLDEAGAAGSCPSCGALYARGAVFCWQCGHDLLERGEAAAPAQTQAPSAASMQPAPAPPPVQPVAQPPQEPPTLIQQPPSPVQPAQPPIQQPQAPAQQPPATPPDARVGHG